MSNVIINKETCIGCGLCVEDCSRLAIELINGKADIELSLCNECSHCVAVCPNSSVSMPLYNKNEIMEYDASKLNLNPDDFLYFQKFRRSIRNFKEKQAEQDKLNQIIEAGRYSPTASNRQLNRYIVIRDRIDEVREMAIKTLYDMANDPSFQMGGGVDYRQSWLKMYDDYMSFRGRRLNFNLRPRNMAVPSELFAKFQISFYQNAEDAVFKALGVE
ncbi:MAG: nitroreductase family protein [Sedimentibacter sp.]